LPPNPHKGIMFERATGTQVKKRMQVLEVKGGVVSRHALDTRYTRVRHTLDTQ
jgi:hypothetical protein